MTTAPGHCTSLGEHEELKSQKEYLPLDSKGLKQKAKGADQPKRD